MLELSLSLTDLQKLSSSFEKKKICVRTYDYYILSLKTMLFHLVVHLSTSRISGSEK